MPYGGVAQTMPLYGNMPQPMMPYGVAQPMAYTAGYSNYPYYSIGSRIRHFFGLAPKGIRYRPDRGTWGFMGYSRRQRYIDPRTGWEVDRRGRPVVRV